MTLGQKIYTYRKQAGLSQDELSYKLNVSRQSVSKWERDESVPELDKLIQLADIFECTVDALVKDGEKLPEKQTCPTRKVFGIIFFTLSMLSLLWGLVHGAYYSYDYYLLFTVPLGIMSAVCFYVKNHSVIYCLWTALLAVELNLRFSTSVDWRQVFAHIRYNTVNNKYTLMMSVLMLALLSIMIVITVFAFKDYPIPDKKRHIKRTLLCLGIVIAIGVIVTLATNIVIMHFNGFAFDRTKSRIFGIICFLLENIIKRAAFIALVTNTVRLVINRK